MKTELLKKWLWLGPILFMSGVAMAQSYSGGAGTPGDPYLIATKADLKYLSENTAEWEKHFKQTADLVFATADFQSGGNFYNGGAGFIPIGNLSTTFTGSYNGQGNSIENLIINRPTSDYIGLFGYVSSSASISNIGMINVNFTGSSYVGGLVGITYNLVTVSNSYVTGTVSGSNYYTGGLVGYNSGFNQGPSTVSNCYSLATVSGYAYVGGFAGGCTFGSIVNCFSAGAVSATGLHVGGLVGYIDIGAIPSKSYWDKEVAGQTYSAGTSTSGRTNSEMKTQSTYVDWDFATIWSMPGNSYPKLRSQLSCGAPVTHTIDSTAEDCGNLVIDGITYSSSGTYTRNFFTTTGCDSIVTLNLTLKLPNSSTLNVTTAGSYTLNSQTYTSAGTYTQVLTNAAGCDSTITLNLTIQYPYSGGAGTVSDPYQISNKADLKFLSENSAEWTKHFKQTADIIFSSADFQSGGDFYNSGEGFIPIGTNSNAFTGAFNGQGYTIENIKITRASSNYIGFFGVVGASASVANIGLVNVNISGASYVGGLAGNNVSTITNCYTTGLVTGYNNYAGGLIGVNETASEVNNCYSTATVTGLDYVGGFMGYNYQGTIDKCYSTGAVDGASSIGGLCGFNNNGTITNSFWNTQTSGQTTGSNGIGKTTVEMKTQSTFTGWDFTNTWILNSSEYPTFRPYITTDLESKLVVSTFSIYPNPATDVLNFGIHTEFEILNTRGELLQKGAGDKVDVSDLSKNLYFIKMNNQTFKFVKE